MPAAHRISPPMMAGCKQWMCFITPSSNMVGFIWQTHPNKTEVIVMADELIDVVFDGTPNHGFHVTIPGAGLFQKGRPKELTQKQAEIVLQLDGFREFDRDTEIMEPPHEPVESYECTECGKGKRHKVTSQIGKDHWEFRKE